MMSSHYVGRDSEQAVSFLVRTQPGKARMPVRLAGFEVIFASPCTVDLGGGVASEEVLTIIRCRAHDASTENYFVRVVQALIVPLGRLPTTQQVAESVVALAEIFRKLSIPARRTLIGLVGELVAIGLASDTEAAVAAWRVDDDEVFDFARGRLRFEVKASSAQVRNHEISYEQANVPADCIGILLSTIVKMSGGGTTLASYLEQIEEKLDNNASAIVKLHQVVADTLGADLPGALEARFDRELAFDSARYYNLGNIPALRGELPVGVTRVRFTTALASVETIDDAGIAAIQAEFGLFPKVLPAAT